MNPATDFDRWADAFCAEWVGADPQHATINQYFDGPEQDAADRRLVLAAGISGAIGDAGFRQTALAERGLAELRAFANDALTDAQRISAAIVEQRLRDAAESVRFASHRPVFSHFGGLHVSLVTFLTTRHPLRNERDAENYVERLSAVAALLDEGIAAARSAARSGIVPPRFILERAIGQIDGLVDCAPAEHPLVTALRTRTHASGVAGERVRASIERATDITRRDVMPALRRVRELLAAQTASATKDAGVWRLPDGAAF